MKPVRDEGAGADIRQAACLHCDAMSNKILGPRANQNTLLTFDPGIQYTGV